MRLSLIPPVLALAWGLNWPAVKILLGALPPFTLRWVGLSLGALLLALIALAQRKPLRLPRGAWPAVLVGGLLNVAVFNLSTAFAQLNTSTSRAAVLTYTMPMMSAALAWWLLGERPDRRRALALLFGMAGIALLAWPVLWGIEASGGAGRVPMLLGLMFPLLAALGWALGTVHSKRWPVAGSRIVVTAWQLAVGAVCAGLGAGLAGERLPASLSAPVALALVFHVAIAMALGYVLWFVLLERSSATVSALTTLMVPVVGVLGAMLLVGDRPSGLDGAGFVLVLAGAGLAMVGPGARPVPARA